MGEYCRIRDNLLIFLFVIARSAATKQSRTNTKKHEIASPLEADRNDNDNNLIQNSKFKIQNSHQGFTLIEMLVVIVVVAIGLVGALSFFNVNINNQNETKNELIAANLAQEGADLVRNIRDYNLLNSSAPLNLKWYSNLYDNTAHTSSCSAVDFNSLAGSSHKCSNAGSAVYVDANSRYNQSSSGNKTDFTRTILIEPSGDLDATGNYIKVTCTVSWNGRTTAAKDILYNNSF